MKVWGTGSGRRRTDTHTHFSGEGGEWERGGGWKGEERGCLVELLLGEGEEEGWEREEGDRHTHPPTDAIMVWGVGEGEEGGGCLVVWRRREEERGARRGGLGGEGRGRRECLGRLFGKWWFGEVVWGERRGGVNRHTHRRINGLGDWGGGCWVVWAGDGREEGKGKEGAGEGKGGRNRHTHTHTPTHVWWFGEVRWFGVGMGRGRRRRKIEERGVDFNTMQVKSVSFCID